MSKFLLINMADYRIASRHETADEASAAHDSCGHPAHVMELGGDWPEFTGVDLAKVYNALPNVTAVKKFADRTTGVRRVNEEIANPTPTPAPGAESPTVTEDPTNTKETTEMAAKKKAKAANGAEKKPRRKPVAANDTASKVTLTAAGKKDDIRGQKGSGRSRVLEAIKRADGSVLVSELVRSCSHFLKREQVMGAIQKLQTMDYIKLE